MPGPGQMNLASLLSTVATTLAVMVINGQQHFDCPLAPHLSPCNCTEKPRGLDISCESVGTVQLREVLDVIEITRQTVWFLRLNRVELSRFPEDLLHGIDVRNLIILQSNVTTLDNTTFVGEPSNMESLDLAKNTLQRVPTQSFTELKSLAALNLDFNGIEILESKSFSGLESLLWLSLYGNRIRVIDSKAFLGTEASLTRLNLGGNKLQEVPRYPLNKLNCLQGLRLHDNNITQVNLEFLPPSLCDLDLSGNGVETIDAAAFSDLPHISALDLEDNKIRTIDVNAFHGIEHSLEWLRLGGNAISSIPTQAFRNLSHLRQLDLRCNTITLVENGAFEHFGKTLKFIFLQKNRIREIEQGALVPLQSAEWLYLHSNEISYFSRATFKPVIDNLHVLDIHDNPFHCDCDVFWFRDWLNTKGANIVNLPIETRCRTPVGLSQKPIVRLKNDSLMCSSGGVSQARTISSLMIIIFLIPISVLYI